MGAFLATVLGFTGVLIIAIAFFIHYLRIGLDSHSSVKIDPKPKA